jgi:hypothetical protein
MDPHCRSCPCLLVGKQEGDARRLRGCVRSGPPPSEPLHGASRQFPRHDCVRDRWVTCSSWLARMRTARWEPSGGSSLSRDPCLRAIEMYLASYSPRRAPRHSRCPPGVASGAFPDAVVAENEFRLTLLVEHLTRRTASTNVVWAEVGIERRDRTEVLVTRRAVRRGGRHRPPAVALTAVRQLRLRLWPRAVLVGVRAGRAVVGVVRHW